MACQCYLPKIKDPYTSSAWTVWHAHQRRKSQDPSWWWEERFFVLPQEQRTPLEYCHSTERDAGSRGSCGCVEHLLCPTDAAQVSLPSLLLVIIQRVIPQRHVLCHQLWLSPISVSCQQEASTEDWEALYGGFSFRLTQLELQCRPSQAANSLPAFHVSVNHLIPHEATLPALTASWEDLWDYNMSVGVLP